MVAGRQRLSLFSRRLGPASFASSFLVSAYVLALLHDRSPWIENIGVGIGLLFVCLTTAAIVANIALAVKAPTLEERLAVKRQVLWPYAAHLSFIVQAVAWWTYLKTLSPIVG